jgi:hypothetical protein
LELNKENEAFSRRYLDILMNFVSSRRWVPGLIATRGRKNITTGIFAMSVVLAARAEQAGLYLSVSDAGRSADAERSGAGFHAAGWAERRLFGADLVGHALPIHGYAQIGLAQVRADRPFRLTPHIFRALPVKICSAKL